MKTTGIFACAVSMLLLIGCCCDDVPRTRENGPIGAGYFTWSSMPVDKIDFSLYRMVFQAFLQPDADGNFVEDPGVLPNTELVEAAHRHGAVVLLSVGGGGYGHFPAFTATPEKTANFAERLVDFIVVNEYDGIDIDWELPRNTEDGQRWAALVRALRERLDQAGRERNGRKYYLTTALPSGAWAMEFIDAETLRTCMDFVNVMCYDLNWGKAAYHAPLDADPADPTASNTLEGLRYLEETVGIPRHRILFGVPFYGNIYTDTAAYTAAGEGKWYDEGYANLAALTADWPARFEPNSCGNWSTSPDGRRVAIFDTPESIRNKTRRVLEAGYAGVFCWAMHHDRMPDGSQPLTEALRQGILDAAAAQ